MQWYRTDRLKFRGWGLQFPTPRGPWLPVLQSVPRSECFERRQNPAPLQLQNKFWGSPKTLSRIRDTDRRRGSALQGTTWNKPCKDSAGAAAERASRRLRRDCPLSFLPRKTGPDGSTPSLHCRGEPGAPRLAATPGGSQLQPFLRRLQSEVHRSRSVGPVRGASRAGAAAPSGRRGALPLSRAPSAPLPRPAGAPGGASALRGRGRPPCAAPWRARLPWPRAGRRPEPSGEEWSWRLARR